MSNFADKRLLQLTSRTLTKSTEVAELWAGTMYEARIENDRTKIVESLKGDDVEKIRTLVHGLASFVRQAESEYVASDESLI